MPRTPEQKAKLKELQAIDGPRAMADYRAAQAALIEKTAQLKAARLARESTPPPAKTRSNTPPAKTRTKATRKTT